MSFEQITKDYLILLKDEGVILDANIMVVNEEFKTSDCIASFLEENTIIQKYICVYNDNGNITWKNLVPIEKNSPII